MEIAENNAQRITLVENAGAFAVVFILCFLVFFAFVTLFGLRLLFAQMSEILAPAWAEIQGFSGRRWRVEGSGVPTSLAVSVALSIFFTAFSVLSLFLGGNKILFSIRRRLVFDFRNGQVILKRRGLFRCPDRIHPISDTVARIEDVEDEDGAKHQVLRVKAVPVEDQRGWFNRLPWRRTLWSEKIEPYQVTTLGRLFS